MKPKCPICKNKLIKLKNGFWYCDICDKEYDIESNDKEFEELLDIDLILDED